VIRLAELTAFKAIKWVFPCSPVQRQAYDDAPLCALMDEQAIQFFADFSQVLLHSTQAKQEPALVALGFWLRTANLSKIRNEYRSEKRQALGSVVQIAPNNIDTLFFYSLVLAVLTGNKVIVRLGNKESALSHLLIELFTQFIEQTQNAAAQRICLLRYPRNEAISRFLVAYAEGLVVWGGDQTVEYFNQLPAPKHCNKLLFPDRFSIALMGEIAKNEISHVAQRFITDVTPFNQQACASPRVVVWLPGVSESSKEAFWDAVEKLWKETKLTVSEHIDKQVYLQYLAMTGRSHSHVRSKVFDVVDMQEVNAMDIEIHCGNFALIQLSLKTLQDIRPLLIDKLQGISTVMLNDADKNVIKTLDEQKAIKRWVKLGQSLQFEHVWDGVDLVFCLSKLSNNP
jgi:hypothetical protein